LNLRPSGYEPDELPGCSTPRRWWCLDRPPRQRAGGLWPTRSPAGFEGVDWKTWRRPTLPCLETQYHGRWGISRPSSGWDRVQAPRHGHQVVQSTPPQPAAGVQSPAGRLTAAATGKRTRVDPRELGPPGRGRRGWRFWCCVACGWLPDSRRLSTGAGLRMISMHGARWRGSRAKCGRGPLAPDGGYRADRAIRTS
jgi:hypothetical protein